MKGFKVRSGILSVGLAMGLSGCMNSIQEDIPFVSRFNSGDAEAAQASTGSQERGQGFSLFKRDENDDMQDTSSKPRNPFSNLFKNNTSGTADTASQNAGGTRFAALFKPNTDEASQGRAETAAQKQAIARAKESAESVIISGLQSRRSLLPYDSSYDKVAGSVLAANSRAAESQLRAARLRAVAASKNWLPSVGPSISLSSLGDLVASLIVEQVIFDNGRKKAERAYAKADVEVAAVNLSMDTNERVFTALGLYLKAQKAAERHALTTKAFNDMSHFEYIMSERVRGGVSDRSDLVVLRQKLAEIRNDLASSSEARSTAMAELNAMSVSNLADLQGIPEIDVQGLGVKPLPILLAEAEKERAIAEATMERASHLPGLKAAGSVDANGKTSLGLNVAADKLFGIGTGASLKAIEVATEGAQRQVAQAREDSNRRLRALESQLKGVQRQVGESRSLTNQSKKNLDLFQAQYKAGTRQVMDVVGVYETYARQQQSAAELNYKSALIRLEIANEMGLLASGAEI